MAAAARGAAAGGARAAAARGGAGAGRGARSLAAGAGASRLPFAESEDVDRVLYTEEQIAARTAELGEQLSKDYAGKNPLVVGVLSGSFMFTADLCRQITPRHTIDFIKASSYEGTESTGKVELTLAPKCEIAGRHILLVEDIVDTGGTISTLRAHFEAAGAASVATATLLDKVARRTIDVPVEYVAFECEDAFVIGYGLDFDGVYRSLPYVGVLKPALYE